MANKPTPKEIAEVVAALYLLHWRICESPNDIDQWPWITPAIIELGYPDPLDIIFDNEAEPHVVWPEDFIYEYWAEDELETSPGPDDNFFTYIEGVKDQYESLKSRML